MGDKRYTTKGQRELLESAGFPHVRGRTYDEAQQLIEQSIQTGRLPRNVLSPPKQWQIIRLREHGIPFPSDITEDEAGALIAQKLDPITPISDRQFSFIIELGGVPSKRMMRRDASRFIDYLMDRQSHCAKCGATDDRRSARCKQCGGFLPKQSPIRPPKYILRPKGLWEKILAAFGLWP